MGLLIGKFCQLLTVICLGHDNGRVLLFPDLFFQGIFGIRYSTENILVHKYRNTPKLGNILIFTRTHYIYILRVSVKQTYDVYYALRLPPDVQIELQRRTTDFRNFFCPSEIDTRDVQKLSKGPPTFEQLYDVCPASYRKFATCVD